MFTSRDFPGRRFKTVAEYEEAKRLQYTAESTLQEREKPREEKAIRVVAQIVPMGHNAMERRVSSLEEAVEAIQRKLDGAVEPEPEKQLDAGTILYGESKGERYTLEVLQDGYLCSNGEIYKTLSGAALGVSGNRRSGWRFWRSQTGAQAGEMTGRFEVGPKAADAVSRV